MSNTSIAIKQKHGEQIKAGMTSKASKLKKPQRAKKAWQAYKA
jgi:hypothetical protein